MIPLTDQGLEMTIAKLVKDAPLVLSSAETAFIINLRSLGAGAQASMHRFCKSSADDARVSKPLHPTMRLIQGELKA